MKQQAQKSATKKNNYNKSKPVPKAKAEKDKKVQEEPTYPNEIYEEELPPETRIVSRASLN